jgi:hypothetical protein
MKRLEVVVLLVAVYVCGVWSGVLYDPQPTAEEAARTYHAYRACIERSSCRMTAQDWIDYYELKWELEEKEIE